MADHLQEEGSEMAQINHYKPKQQPHGGVGDNNNKKKKMKPNQNRQMASISETIGFVFCGDYGSGSKVLFGVGTIAAFLNGLVGPMLAILFSIALSRGSVVGVDLEDVAYDDIKQISFGLVGVGLWAFFMTFVQTVCFEITAFRATHELNLQWFQALLRQDAAFFDVYDVPGIAAILQPTCYQYRRGMGSKLGEGIQYTTTVIGGVGFAFYASWKISILVLAVLPVCIACSVYAVHLSQSRTAQANISYKRAGGIAYSTVSSLRTILAFNAVPHMIEQYKEATEEAAAVSTRFLVKYGIAGALFLSSYMVMFVAVSMYGAKLLYTEIEEMGCDPTAGMFSGLACETTGANILGTFLGFLFSAEGISQIANSFQGIVEARVAAFEALRAIQRKAGAPREILYHSGDDHRRNRNNKTRQGKEPGMSDTESDSEEDTNLHLTLAEKIDRQDTDEIEFVGTVGTKFDCGKVIQNCYNKLKKEPQHHRMDEDLSDDVEYARAIESMENVRAILPRFEIDSSDVQGVSSANISGHICFDRVCFSYPTRPSDRVLHDFSLDIEAGKTVALVGPSGGGKSTIVSMIERFYDPCSGNISLDGFDLKQFNVSYLRSKIGYVGQEPALFATTVRENIRYGCPGATHEQIIAAAKMANAHDFISEFPLAYETHVGDKGSQLSGGQRQRLAIARALVSNKTILLLDEATSALDSESELQVQSAIDNVLAQKKLTTIIVAHRLSTIRNADAIAVVVDGGIVETGTHDKLMEDPNSYYRKLVLKQDAPKVEGPGLETADTIVSALSTTTYYRRISTVDAPDDVELRMTKTMTRPDVEAVYYTNFPQNGQVMPPHINFKGVSFAYPARPTKPIFEDFNLSIKCGESIALVGPSGGGKSTTVAMIERYYDPSEGALEYMGHNIRSLNPQWYRDQIGFVSQEPTLLNDTIAKNIAFGDRGATREKIVEAAKQANAHEFILGFPDGYNTQVGNHGKNLSGGQKQRIAIARALVKSPKLLILDEATSALDSDSEAIVQAALNKLMASREHTTIVIAHRLSTVKSADQIAFVADGKVHEFGSHEELMGIENGRYRRLVEAQKRTSTLSSVGLLDDLISLNPSSSALSESSGVTKICNELEDLGTTYFSARRVWQEAAHDFCYILLGSLGGIVNGAIFPFWGVMFAQTINLLFQRVLECPSDAEIPVEGFETCHEYWADSAEIMKQRSNQIGLAWAVLIACSFVGSVSSRSGFGTAAEHLNKRIRDSTFTSLVRQEISFFDTHSIGKLLSVLQDDTSKLYAFTGEPLRQFWLGVTSVAIGIALSFFFVWPVALVALGCIPLLGYAMSLRMGSSTGVDRGVSDAADKQDNATGVVVETLHNIRTVAALTLEDQKFHEFKDNLHASEPNNYRESAKTAVTHGMGCLLHHWVDSLLLFFAGWLLHNYPAKFTFLEVLNSNFALYFSLFGLGVALKEIADREEIKKATSRVFFLLDRESALDPLYKYGHKLD